jgi:hypothetical protein
MGFRSKIGLKNGRQDQPAGLLAYLITMSWVVYVLYLPTTLM